LKVPEFGQVRQLLGLDRAALVLDQDQDVHDPDDAGIVQSSSSAPSPVKFCCPTGN